MIGNQKELFKCIDEILNPDGYVRKKYVWYKHTPECICFLHVEKSPYNGKYSNLMGCFVKELGWKDGDFPGTEFRSLGFWMEKLGADKGLIDRLFDLDNREFVENEREILLRELLEIYAKPFLEEIGTKEGIKEAIVKYPTLKNTTKLNLRVFLGLKEEGGK